MTGGLPITPLDVLEMTHVIALTVLEDMRLVIEPQEIARDAEHNSATFRIVQQPASLDSFVCRAEVATVQGTNHRLVIDGEFTLTSDIAVQGTNTLQLVYSDGEAVIRKTYKTPFHVSASINAIDPSEPEYENGIGQLQRACFANAVGGDSGIQFYNVADQPLDFVAWPPGSGEGLDEATANLLYLRLDGTRPMNASVGFNGPNRGVTWEDAAIQGAIYSTGTQLVMRRALGNTPIAIEDNSGSPGTRSPIITELMGDQRYLREINANDLYLAKSGGQMSGPLITAPGGSTTNPGLAIGENSTGFFRAGGTLLLSVGGQLYSQYLGSPPSLMMVVPINMATQGIQSMADPRDGPTGAQDAVNRRTMDAAIAAIPRPTVPASRVFIPNEVTIATAAVEFFNQPFFTNDNSARTIVVTVYPQFSGGQPSSFYDLEYSTNLSVGLVERSTVYPTAQGYMGGGQAVCFAVTVTPVSAQIQVSLSVRMMAANPGPDLIQIGSRATQRSYVLIQEMTN